MKRISFILFFLLGTLELEAKLPHSKYLQELTAGYAFGAIGWCAGVNGANAIWNTKDAATIGGYVLYGLGASIGVWLTGSQHDKGKYFDTLLGTVLFPIILTSVKKAMGIELSEVDEVISFSLPVGAFIGYNLSRAKQ